MGCASLIFGPKELTPEGKKVKLMKADPDDQCEEIGGVEGAAAAYEKDYAAKVRMRNNAAKLGANYVRMETVERISESGPRKYTGTAYKCL